MDQNYRHTLSGLAPFSLLAKYVELYADSPLNENEDHIHGECEIYVNLSGDVAFAVEGTVYPIRPGTVVITRPSEYHHCIYRSSRLHRHFWILFSTVGNERLFDLFFDRKAGTGNLLILPQEEQEALFSLCKTLSDNETSELARYACFFRLIELLGHASTAVPLGEQSDETVLRALSYMEKHLNEPLTVSEVARACSVSVNTLERRFAQALRTTPRLYLRQKRLAYAKEILRQGCGVTEAADKSGFSDTSGFITHFKSAYGITPLQYKKENRRH